MFIMKIRYFFIVFAFAILCLLSLQGVWLYNTYQLKLDETKTKLGVLFIESINNELNIRFIDYLQDVSSKDITSTSSFEIDNNVDGNSGIVSQQFIFIQKVLLQYNMSFNIASLDSIYTAILSEENINVNFMLTYKTDGEVIDIVGDIEKSDYRTVDVPIVGNSYIHADISIAPPVVFQQMFGILLISLLMFLILMLILVYQTRYIFTQHRLNQLRENFTHALTHDMKTPLGTIYNVLNQLKTGSLDNNPIMREKFCEIANGQVLNLQVLVEQILTIAYIEQRKLTLNKKLINLEEMTYRLIDKFMAKGGKNIEFDTYFALNGDIAYADPLYLENAISNLIDNAIKYSENSVKICIECVSNQKMIFVKVRDNGIGISAIDQDKIFERFERGSAVKNKKTSGFGLGLNYVKNVIEAHGGTIALSSKFGEGSEFVIGIPIVVTSMEQNKYTHETN